MTNCSWTRTKATSRFGTTCPAAPDWDDGTAAMTVNYETITVTAPTVTVGALEDAADEDAGGLLLRINIADPDINDPAQR